MWIALVPKLVQSRPLRENVFAMINRAVILAHRFVFEGGSVVSPSAVAMIRRALTSLARLGVRDICVVDGDQAELLRERLELGSLIGVNVRVLANRSWRRAGGSALRIAQTFIGNEPCLILRGDRPLDDETLANLVNIELGQASAAVVVGSTPEGLLTDEVKVQLGTSRADRSARNPRVVGIGLDLERYDAVFTGHAVVSPAIIDAFDGIPNPSIEDGFEVLVRNGETVRALSGGIEWPWGVRRPAEVDDKVEALLAAKEHPEYTLFNPGPVNTTARVKSALVHHDMCHRDGDFSELMVSLTGKLRRIFRASSQHSVVLITGSGTAAMESAISSSVPTDRKALIIDNGAFGERILEIARLHQLNTVHLRYAWGDMVDPADVSRAFEAHPEIEVVVMVHHETSVGLLNPIREVGALCKQHDALFVVDAVSSLGAEDLDVVRDNIDICYGSANKCLHAVSGTGFLCVSPRTWAKIEGIRPRSYYLNLKRYRYYMDELAQTPFTPAVSSYFALDAACDEFLTDGHGRRWAEYRRRNQRLRRGLQELGMAPFTRTGKESNSVVTACVPNGVTFAELYDGLKNRGFIIYGCKSVLAEKFLQIANMGNMSSQTIDALLEAMREVIAEIRAAQLTASRTAFAERGEHGGRIIGHDAVSAGVQ